MSCQRLGRFLPPLLALLVVALAASAQLIHPLASARKPVDPSVWNKRYLKGHAFTNYPGFGPSVVTEPFSQTPWSIVRISIGENSVLAGHTLLEVLEVELREADLKTPRSSWITWQTNLWGAFGPEQFAEYRRSNVAVRFEAYDLNTKGFLWTGARFQGTNVVYPAGFQYPTNWLRAQLYLDSFFICYTSGGELGSPMPRPTRIDSR